MSEAKRIRQVGFWKNASVASELRNLVAQLCERLKAENLIIKADTEASWVEFEKLSPDRQLGIYSGFKNYSDFIQSYLEEGSDLSNSRELVAKVVSRLNLRMPKGATDLIRDEYIIEIYDMEGFQLFRNFRFLECVSYSFSELLIYEWTQLFRRPKAITDAILACFIKFAQGQAVAPLPSQCPLHVIEEIFSEGRHKALIDQKEFIPLFHENDSEKVVAVMVLIKAELLSEKEGQNIRALDVKSRRAF